MKSILLCSLLSILLSIGQLSAADVGSHLQISYKCQSEIPLKFGDLDFHEHFEIYTDFSSENFVISWSEYDVPQPPDVIKLPPKEMHFSIEPTEKENGRCTTRSYYWERDGDGGTVATTLSIESCRRPNSVKGSATYNYNGESVRSLICD